MLEEADDQRLISVVMAIKDEAQNVRTAIAQILEQQIAGWEVEVLIAVAPSSDSTESVVAELAREDPRVRTLSNPVGSAPAGLNIALREARGVMVCRIDGHTSVAPDFLAEAVRVLTRTRASGVGGRVTYQGDGRIGRAVATAMASRLGGGGGAFRNATAEVDSDTLMFGLYRQEVFDRVGWFDESLIRNQDDEWHHRGRLLGERFVVSPDISFTHRVRESFSDLWRQHYEWGQYRVATLRKHRRLGAARQAAAPGLVALLVLAGVAQIGSRRTRIAGRAFIASYSAALALGGVRASATNGSDTDATLVAVALGIMHVGYGAGFWHEVIRARLT